MAVPFASVYTTYIYIVICSSSSSSSCSCRNVLTRRYKDDSTTPIYALDSRRTTLKNAHHSPAPWLAGRAYLDAVSGDINSFDDADGATPQGKSWTKTSAGRKFIPTTATGTAAAAIAGSDLSAAAAATQSPSAPSLLRLDSLEKSDEALYRCRVDFRRARTRNYEVRLVVISK